jgi:hypothetical protein
VTEKSKAIACARSCRSSLLKGGGHKKNNWKKWSAKEAKKQTFFTRNVSEADFLRLKSNCQKSITRKNLKRINFIYEKMLLRDP